MHSERKLTLSPADVRAAVELWLNSQVLKVPVTVESVTQHSAKAKEPHLFEVTLRPQAEDNEVPGCASSYPVASE